MNQVIEAYGSILPYVFVLVAIGILWDMVIRAFQGDGEMIEQYDTYGTISTTYQEFFADHVGLFDEYIAMRTGEYQYQCLIKNIDGSVDLISVDRVGTSGYNYYYQATITESTWDYNYNNELYVYSNVGIGQQLPVEYDHITAIGVVAICTLLTLKAVFPVLFRPWGKGRAV